MEPFNNFQQHDQENCKQYNMVAPSFVIYNYLSYSKKLVGDIDS